MAYQLLNRASYVPSEDSDVRPGIRQDIFNLEKRCTDRADALVQCINAIFKKIVAEVSKAVGVAEGRSPTVFKNIALTLKWNQYLALMRREGEYGPNNLNTDLTATIFPSIQTQWHMGINVEIPTLLSDFFQEIKGDLDRSSLGVESFVKELSHAVQQLITLRQRKASRIWAPSMKAQLVPQYAIVAAEKGRGMFGRMKVRRQYTHISSNLGPSQLRRQVKN
ncbi:hypothetical protein B0H10DRAFT_2029236 [Mycena sp. CBHHK59/15]|nr:hypothetical protein B0H10DRAFT_2029236 [Mycena sp. CBHHK59/15]